jgi:hypothetical protein
MSRGRTSAWAGQFYPADSIKLEALIANYLADKSDLQTGPVLGLIAPHAGFEFSGQTAASAYRKIASKKFDTIIVLAPSHAEAFPGVSIFSGDYYETPLGRISVDHQLAGLVQEGDEIIHVSEFGHRTDGHRAEHSLEVQLPFLQVVLDDFEILPIVFHDYSVAVCQHLGLSLSRALREKKCLIVASSDLYHGYSYKECMEIDTTTIKSIEADAPESFLEAIQDQVAQACGAGPIAALQFAARAVGNYHTRCIDRANSADITGQYSGWTVGYASFVVAKDS